MKVYASVQRLYSADLFQPDNLTSDDAVLSYYKRISFALNSAFSSQLTIFSPEKIPLRWVFQNFTGPNNQVLFVDSLVNSVAYRVTSQAPVTNDLTGVELYKYALVRI